MVNIKGPKMNQGSIDENNFEEKNIFVPKVKTHYIRYETGIESVNTLSTDIDYWSGNNTVVLFENKDDLKCKIFEVNDEMNEINKKYDTKVKDYMNYIIHDAIVYNEYVKNYNTNN